MKVRSSKSTKTPSKQHQRQTKSLSWKSKFNVAM